MSFKKHRKKIAKCSLPNLYHFFTATALHVPLHSKFGRYLCSHRIKKFHFMHSFIFRKKRLKANVCGSIYEHFYFLFYLLKVHNQNHKQIHCSVHEHIYNERKYKNLVGNVPCNVTEMIRVE